MTMAFVTGWNHPWIGYGHDFGRAWGHDGLSTNGWTCAPHPDIQGFTDSEVTTDPVSGRGALRIHAELSSGSPGRDRGAVYVSLVDHWPFACPPPESSHSVNLDRAVARLRVRLPRGSAGSARAPHGLHLFLKTRLSAERWPSLYTRVVTIDPGWEERDVDIVIPLDAPNAAHVDPDFDITRVSLIGFGMSAAAGSLPSTVSGTVWLDEFVLETVPPLAFDFERTEIDAQFAQIRARRGDALSLVRFFLFCDGRAAPSFGSDGHVVGLDEAFFRDLDVLLRAAAHHNLQLVPVLLDFGWCAYPRIVGGVQLGGRADVIRETAKRRTFLERALAPTLERYGEHPAIFAWDVCNEPEWIIDGLPGAFGADHVLVPLADMRAFVRDCADYVHRMTSNQSVTLGSARRKWLHLWKGTGLDVYQFHWYDHFQNGEPFPWGPYEELGLDRPCLVGEVPTASTRFTQEEFLDAAQAGGYSGLLFWSYGARDRFSHLR
jgi:hypothetical protein